MGRRCIGRGIRARTVVTVRSLGLAGFALLFPGMAAAETAVDLELVLAVDVSGSMDVDEQHVQRAGYVAALLHPDVLSAIRSGQHVRIAVTYVEWAG